MSRGKVKLRLLKNGGMKLMGTEGLGAGCQRVRDDIAKQFLYTTVEATTSDMYAETEPKIDQTIEQ